MQIKKAIIENFKSITNEEIDFTHDCKIFVGLSESGKTNLLLALSALDTTFTLNKTFIKEGTKTSEPSLIEYDLSLDKKEKETVIQDILKDIYSTNNKNIILQEDTKIPVETFINYDICYEIDIRTNTRTYKYFSYDNSHNYTINPNYAFVNRSTWPIKVTNKKTKEQVSVTKKVLINLTEFDIPETNIKTIKDAEELYDFFENKILSFSKNASLPKTLFWKYDESTILPSEVSIISFSSNPRFNLPLYYIFKLSNIDNIYTQYKECKEMSETAFQNILDEVSKNLNKYLKKVWKSMSNVNIQLDEYVDKIRIRIVDAKNKYVLQDRSDGFKRLITCMIMLSIKNENNLLNNNLILIDEPNSQIDIPGQKYLMSELIKIGKNNYVFYSTHSDSMIDTNNIERHYIVSKENESTTIEIATEENYDNAAALYQALGMNIYKVINPNNLVFEGWTDTHLLDIVVSSDKTYKKSFNSIGVTHVGGAKNFKSFARYWGLLSRNYIIIADNDEPANREKKIFEEEHYDGKWFTYADFVLTKTVVTAEDFLKNEYIIKIANNFSKANNFINQISSEKLENDGKMDTISQWISSNVSKEKSKELEKEFKKILFNSLIKKDIEIKLYKEFICNLLKQLEK